MAHWFPRKYPTARKEYKCCWCGELILVGQKYSSQTCSEAGQLDTTRLHIECDKALCDFATEEKARSWYILEPHGTRGHVTEKDFDYLEFDW